MASASGPRFNVSFELKARPGNNTGSIRAVVTHGGKRVRFPIGHAGIARNSWDKKSHSVKGYTMAVSDANASINEIRRAVHEWFDHPNHGSLSELQFRITGQRPQGAIALGVGADGSPAKGITALFQAYIADKTKPGIRPISQATVDGYTTIMKALVQFEEGTNTILSPSLFAMNARHQYTEASELVERISYWLATQHVRQGHIKNGEKGLADNTRHRAMRGLATVIRWSEKQGLGGISRLYTDFGHTKEYCEVQVALSESDITAIESLQLPVHSLLWDARNLFLIGIWTGLRISDWHGVDPKRWQEKQQIVKTTKTGGTAVVIHTPRLQSVLRHYVEIGLPTYVQPNAVGEISYNGKINSWIKAICTMAQLTTPVDKITKQNDRSDIETVPFAALVSTHSARRTFVSQKRQDKISDEHICRMTGHKNSSSLKTYDRTTPDQLADLIQSYRNNI